MTDHHPPPPLRLLNLRTATEILNRTTTIFSTRHHLCIFLILSFLLFSLRTNVENLTHFITTYIDNNPNPTTVTTTHHRHHHRPFFQLTRIGILDDDSLSGDNELNPQFFGNIPNPKLNHTSFILDSFDPQLGFSNFISDNGIRVSEIVRSFGTTSFRAIEIKKQENRVINNGRVEFQRRELNTMLTFVGVLSGSYGLMIIAFVVTNIWVHGVVFVLVVNVFLNKHMPFSQIFEKGAILGSRRLYGFVIMRWAVRDVFTQVLGLFFFGEIEDQDSLFKIFIRMKFMPFSTAFPWIKGFEQEIYGFMLTWFLLDLVISFVFALDAWVAMADPRKSGKEVMEDGCHLLSIMINPAINLKSLEGIACGSFARHILTHIFGKVFASMIQCFMEVYFMVAWMMHYLSVKSKDAECNGVTFGNSELEAMLEDDR
ncbi:hypothetical protein QVD17_11607 [Tagetes erecta]|uniref:Uncharacterized protein n=1 Tax=Tagetes erecta TaxID=13708 RepID=A0AAD8KXL7_TARER|nr:hypothetical protein QVD17_11607 [Tagetes erecta]